MRRTDGYGVPWQIGVGRRNRAVESPDAITAFTRVLPTTPVTVDSVFSGMLALGVRMIYDDLTGSTLDDGKWRYLEVPLGNGQFWRYAEPEATTDVADGSVSIRADTFTRAHNEVQMLDNPKHLLVSTAAFDVSGARRSFSAKMAGRNVGLAGEDYRDGFAAFTVLDMSSAYVYELAATGRQAYAIHQRLAVPGRVDQADAFAHVVHSPFTTPHLVPDEFHQYAIIIDPTAKTVLWQIDGTTVFATTPRALPEKVQVGFGIITMHPILNGRSTSVRGQGFRARWRRFTVD